MPSQDFTGYTANIKESDGKKVYDVAIEVTNAAGDCTITKINVDDAEDIINDTGNIDTMKLRENLLSL